MTVEEISTKLSAPFDDCDIEWRYSKLNPEKTNGLVVAYVTNRAIQNRLDAVVGIDKWKNEFQAWHPDKKNNKESQLCGLSIWIEERGEWVTKYDGADDSDTEPIKGGLSDSMKRAAVQWGIGRYLYEMPNVYADSEREKYIKRSEYAKLNTAHQALVARLFQSNIPTPSSVPQNPFEPQSPPRQSQQSAPVQQIQQSVAGQQTQQTKPNPQAAPMQKGAVSAQQPQPQAQTQQQGQSQAQRQPQTQQQAKPAQSQKPVPESKTQSQAQSQPSVPEGSYMILRAAHVANVKRGQDTSLQLQAHNGEQLEVFLRGTNPQLVCGAVITNCKITIGGNKEVVFNILEDYSIVRQRQAA